MPCVIWGWKLLAGAPVFHWTLLNRKKSLRISRLCQESIKLNTGSFWVGPGSLYRSEAHDTSPTHMPALELNPAILSSLPLYWRKLYQLANILKNLQNFKSTLSSLNSTSNATYCANFLLTLPSNSYNELSILSIFTCSPLLIPPQSGFVHHSIEIAITIPSLDFPWPSLPSYSQTEVAQAACWALQGSLG